MHFFTKSLAKFHEFRVDIVLVALQGVGHFAFGSDLDVVGNARFLEFADEILALLIKEVIGLEKVIARAAVVQELEAVAFVEFRGVNVLEGAGAFYGGGVAVDAFHQLAFQILGSAVPYGQFQGIGANFVEFQLPVLFFPGNVKEIVFFPEIERLERHVHVGVPGYGAVILEDYERVPAPIVAVEFLDGLRGKGSRKLDGGGPLELAAEGLGRAIKSKKRRES